MMLIGKTAQRQAAFLRALGDAGPVHMRCDIRAANALQRRRSSAMRRITLQRAARAFRRIKLVARVTVIDRQDKSASEFPRHGFNPFQRREIDLGLVRRGQIRGNLCDLPAQILVADWFGHESKTVARFLRPIVPATRSQSAARSNAPASHRAIHLRNELRKTALDRRAIFPNATLSPKSRSASACRSCKMGNGSMIR